MHRRRRECEYCHQRFSTYERPILAGDRIYVSTKVADVLEKPGPAGKMDVAVIEDEGRDEEGNLVFRARRTLVVRAAKENA